MNYCKCQSIDKRTGERCIQLVDIGNRYCKNHTENSKPKLIKSLLFWVLPLFTILSAFVAFKSLFPKTTTQLANEVGIDTCHWEGFSCTLAIDRGKVMQSKFKCCDKPYQYGFSSCFLVEAGGFRDQVKLHVPSELKIRLEESLNYSPSDYVYTNLFETFDFNHPVNISADADRLLFKGFLKDYKTEEVIFNFNHDQHKSLNNAVLYDHDKYFGTIEVLDQYGYVIFRMKEVETSVIKFNGYFHSKNKIIVVTDDGVFVARDKIHAEELIKLNYPILNHDNDRIQYI